MKHLLSAAMTVLLLAGAVRADDRKGQPTPEELKKVEAALPKSATAKPVQPRKVLIFDKTGGFYHSVIPLASKALALLGEKTGAYEAVISQDMSMFDADKLAGFDAVILNNTTKLPLKDPAQRQALLSFVREGKGLVGVHAASDNFYDWPEGAAMMGGLFDGHPWRANGTWAIKLDDPDHPVNKGFGGKGFKVRDEIYQIKGDYSRKTHRTLVSLDMSDEATAAPKGQKRADKDNAISWLQREGKGRVFYCSFGHNRDIFWNSGILKHFLDGIQYAIGDLKADDTPSAEFEGAQKKAALSRYLEGVKTYRFNGEKMALSEVEAIVRDSDPSGYAAIEAELVKVLQDKKATPDGKQFVCRMLRRIGSEAAVPALAALLPEPTLSHMARFALQGIDSPKADDALIAALKAAPALQKVGIVGSLGSRGSKAAVPALAALVNEPQRELRQAAINALGRIGSPEALAAIRKAEGPADEANLRTAALLVAADKLAASGDVELAASVYRELLKGDSPTWVGVAALRGMLVSTPAQGTGRFIALLGSPKEGERQVAMAAAGCLPAGKEATLALANKLDGLPSTGQSAVLELLQARGDSAAAGPVSALANSAADAAVRQQALRVLGSVGRADAVPVLVAALAKAGEDAQAAHDGLVALSAPGVGNAIAEQIGSSTAPAVTVALIDVAVTRLESAAADALLKQLKSKDEKVRDAAISGMSKLASATAIPAMAQAVSQLTAESEARGLVRAIGAVIARDPAAPEHAAALTEAVGQAKGVAKASLLSILPDVGGDKALSAIRDGLNDSEMVVVKAAVKAAGEWKDAAPMKDLLSLASTTEDQILHVLAIRSAVSLSLKTDSLDARVDGLGQAAKVATRVDEKRMILGQLAKLKTKKSAELITALGKDPTLAEEAKRALELHAVTSIKTSAMGGSHGDPADAIDGKLETRWGTGHGMQPGDWYMLDFEIPRRIKSITLDVGEWKNDYPRGLDLFVSNDGKNWGNPVKTVKNLQPKTTISLDKAAEGRYLKLVQKGREAVWWWTIAELSVGFEQP